MKHLIRFSLAIVAIAFTTVAMAQGPFNGYVLYNKQNNQNAYLIDKDGNIAHTWNCDLNANYAMALTDDGNLVRGAINNGNSINGPAVGGRIQELDPNGDVVWEFTYSTSNYVQHHDICLMPNGNVLMIAWYVRSTADLEQHGYDNPTGTKYSTRILEVQQNGTGGQIVWEWDIWDHMIQDHDATKDNFGVVADHPELLDINVEAGGGGGPGPGGGGDWFHANGIDYNPTLDQIAFTCRYLHEFFIIDHSTTTAEAAGHTGGNSGKGGDFLYRWGNPENYGAGAQVVPAALHDVRWIKDGRPNAGYLQFFNNEGGNGVSTVDAVNPPVDGYNYTLTPGQAYGPASHDWRHTCLEEADGQSASDRMTNGNTFVAMSQEYMYEVNDQGTVVWQYADDPQKAFRYECDHPGLAALLGPDPCGLVGIDETEAAQINIAPNPSNGIFTISGLPVDETVSAISIYDMIGKQVYSVSSNNTIDLTGKDNGFYIISIDFEGGDRITRKVCLNK